MSIWLLRRSRSFFTAGKAMKGFICQLEPIPPERQLVEQMPDLAPARRQGVDAREIPKRIMQTNESRKVPQGVYIAAMELMRANPDHSYEYFDEQGCRRFLADEYPPEVLDAYDALIPGAYKADLFRYCYLFRRGGVYIDCGMLPAVEGSELGSARTALAEPGAKTMPLSVLIGATDRFVSAEDDGTGGVYNAFIAAVPGHPILGEAIRRTLRNVKLRKPGKTPLSITGPGVLGKAYRRVTGSKPKPDSRSGVLSDPTDRGSITLDRYKRTGFCTTVGEISRGGVVGLVTKYPEYYQDQKWYNTNPHYFGLWAKGEVYRR